MEWILFAFISVCLLFVLAVRCRKGHRGLAELRGWKYAHRGLHGGSRPENSMSAFRAALDHGYGIELDVHLLKDGTLAVMHDFSLARTAGADVRIEDLTAGELENYRLEGTGERIPLFREVLDLYAGRAPLIIELKTDGKNYSALSEAVCRIMEGYDGPYCVESFDPRCVMWLKNHRPEVIRGQLTRNFFSTKDAIPWILKFVMRHQLMNFLTVPDFIAYRFDDRKTVSNLIALKIWGAQGVSWTLRDRTSYDVAVSEGWIPIFENFEP